jgi:hypothetical protein
MMTKHPWCNTCGKDVPVQKIECEKCAKWWAGNDPDKSAIKAEIERLRDLLRRLDPFLDSIVCYASTIGEHEANRVVADIRAALQPKEGEE